MKKIILIICLLISYPVVASDKGYNGNFSSNNNGQQTTRQSADDDSVTQSQWDEIYNQTIDERFGSVESPAFLNRENIDPEEANTGESGD